MFDKNFYPTPKEVIAKMLQDIPLKTLSNMKILEPSAGKGNICDYIFDLCYDESPYYNKFKKSQISCIEKNVELQHIIKSKGYRLIDNDFLTYQPEEVFKLIVMNPPFDRAEEHFLKAHSISKGAEIRCLYPTARLKNPHTVKQEIVNEIIEKEQGKKIDLGSCFKDAERETNVEVTLIIIPAKKHEPMFNFSGFSSKGEKYYSTSDFTNNQIAKTNVAESVVDRYEKTKEVFARYINVMQELIFYTSGLISEDITTLISQSGAEVNSRDEQYYNFCQLLKKSCWNKIISETKMKDVVTTKVREEFSKFIDDNKNMSFTLENIAKLFQLLMLNTEDLMTKSVMEAFDYLTAYHKENRLYVEGFKTEGWITNKHWKVAKKVILPGITSNSWSSYVSLYHGSWNKLDDLDKALCFVAGVDYSDIIEESLFRIINQKKLSFGELYESYFFRFRCYKKGTIHLEFKEKHIYEKFNLIACKGKNWLPSDFNDGSERKQKPEAPKTERKYTYKPKEKKEYSENIQQSIFKENFNVCETTNDNVSSALMLLNDL